MSLIQKINVLNLSKDELILSKKLKKILGFSPKNISYYKEAFTHNSFKDKSEKKVNYERLEFLGDAILGAVIAAFLFERMPLENEGHLTKMRSKIVSRVRLNELGNELKLLEFMQVDTSKTNLSNNIEGNIFEALVGAIYMDKGYMYCQKFIHKKVIQPYIDIESLENKIISYKSLFIEWCQKCKNEYEYEVYEDTGKNSLKHFSVKLHLNGKVIAKGRATSKKKAEEIASKRAYYANQNKISC